LFDGARGSRARARAIVGPRIFVSRNELLIANWRSFHAAARRLAQVAADVKAIDKQRRALQWQEGNSRESRKKACMRVGAHIHGSLRDSDEL
jgi:hypothetical protein